MAKCVLCNKETDHPILCEECIIKLGDRYSTFPNQPKDKSSVIDKAEKIVNGHRSNGKKEMSFSSIADYWNVYLSEPHKKGNYITEYDVAMMMILLKIARAEFSYNEDNYVDICGYAQLANELKENESE